MYIFQLRVILMLAMSVEVLRPTNTLHPTHLVCDLPFWKDAWKLLSTANFDHGRAIDKFLTKTEVQIGQLGPKDTLLPAEQMLIQDLRLLQDIFKDKKVVLQNDASLYNDLERTLKQHVDDPDIRVASLNLALTQDRTKLDTQTGLVAKCKQDYHKSMWHLEKGGIKDMLTDKDSTPEQMRKSIEDLQHRAQSHLDKYNKNLDKWNNKLGVVKQLSADYERSFVTRETSRATVILNSLQKSIELTSNGNYTKTNASFDDIDAESIVRNKIIKKDSIDIPIFEVYKEERGKKKMYARARARVQMDIGRSTEVAASRGQDSDYGDEAARKERLKVNKKLKKVKLLYLTVTGYQRQEMNQLTLKVGDYVRQMLPANDDGYAYGEVVHGKIRRKKKTGFYPACHVTAVNAEDLDITYMEEVVGCSDDELDLMRSETTHTRNEAKKPRADSRKMSRNGTILPSEDRPVSPVETNLKASKAANECRESENEAKEKKRNKIFSAIANSSFVQKLKSKNKAKDLDAAQETEVSSVSPLNARPVGDMSRIKRYIEDDDAEAEAQRTSRLARKSSRNACSEAAPSRDRTNGSSRSGTENGPIIAWGNPEIDIAQIVGDLSTDERVAKIEARARRRASRMAEKLEKFESSKNITDVTENDASDRVNGPIIAWQEPEVENARVDLDLSTEKQMAKKVARAKRRAPKTPAEIEKAESSQKSTVVAENGARKRRMERKERKKADVGPKSD